MVRVLSRRHFLGKLTLGLGALFGGTVLRQALVTSGENDGGRRQSLVEGVVFPDAVTKPYIISRAGWGADESLRFSNGSEIWPAEYFNWVKAVLHHTATSTDQDPLVAIRAIYYYHAVSLGWGDIGYNYLIDRNGNIYEGRYGGENVQGGHVYGYNRGSMGVAVIGNYQTNPISSAAEAAVVSLLSWWSSSRGISPLGSSFFIDKVLPNIMGHRDANTTSCPGDAFYAQIPTIRNEVVGQRPAYGESWGSHNTPVVMVPGYTANVAVNVQNVGGLTWLAGGSKPFHLGYHWYDSNGNQYVQTPEDDKRSVLPFNVAPDQKVTVNALLTSPRSPGNYTLKWDMVQEGVTWFSAEPANRTLDVAIAVALQPLPVDPQTLNILVFGLDRPAFGFILITNPGSGPLYWDGTVVSGSWLNLNPSSGQAPGTLMAIVDAAQLADGGSYQGLIRLTGSSGGTQQYTRDVPVNVQVTRMVGQVFFPYAGKH